MDADHELDFIIIDQGTAIPVCTCRAQGPPTADKAAAERFRHNPGGAPEPAT